MKQLKFFGGCLHVYEDEKLIMKTRGNPSKVNGAPFLSEQEALDWYNANYPEQKEELPENLNEETI